MPAIFERSTEKLIQVMPNYPSSLEMAGKFVVDYPDYMNLDIDGLDITASVVAIKADILSAKDTIMESTFSNYKHILTNNLEDLASVDPSSDLGFELDQVFPWATTGEFLESGVKISDSPNCVAVMGRYPTVNHVSAGVSVNDDTLTGGHALITKEIDITSYTADGLGRSDYMVYFRGALKSYVKDITPLEGVNSEGVRGGLFYTQTDKSSELKLRLFISADNGNSYQEMDSLSPFQFPSSKDKIRLAFVNFTNVDLHLLSFTLMF